MSRFAPISRPFDTPLACMIHKSIALTIASYWQASASNESSQAIALLIKPLSCLLLSSQPMSPPSPHFHNKAIPQDLVHCSPNLTKKYSTSVMSLPWMLKSHTSKSYTNSMMSNPANSLDCLFAQCLPSGQEGVKYRTLYFWSSHQTTMARNDSIFMPGPPQDLKKKPVLPESGRFSSLIEWLPRSNCSR